jgi:hypothetical protein
MEKNATKIVAGAIVGLDFKVVVVNGKAYAIHPPTIAKIAGATSYLSDIEGGETLQDILMSLTSIESATKALSWLIAGNESLSEELAQGTLEEVVSALEQGLMLISAENFIKLSLLARSVQKVIAKLK